MGDGSDGADSSKSGSLRTRTAQCSAGDVENGLGGEEGERSASRQACGCWLGRWLVRYERKSHAFEYFHERHGGAPKEKKFSESRAVGVRKEKKGCFGKCKREPLVGGAGRFYKDGWVEGTRHLEGPVVQQGRKCVAEGPDGIKRSTELDGTKTEVHERKDGPSSNRKAKERSELEPSRSKPRDRAGGAQPVQNERRVSTPGDDALPRHPSPPSPSDPYFQATECGPRQKSSEPSELSTKMSGGWVDDAKTTRQPQITGKSIPVQKFQPYSEARATRRAELPRNEPPEQKARPSGMPSQYIASPTIPSSQQETQCSSITFEEQIQPPPSATKPHRTERLQQRHIPPMSLERAPNNPTEVPDSTSPADYRRPLSSRQSSSTPKLTRKKAVPINLNRQDRPKSTATKGLKHGPRKPIRTEQVVKSPTNCEAQRPAPREGRWAEEGMGLTKPVVRATTREGKTAVKKYGETEIVSDNNLKGKEEKGRKEEEERTAPIVASKILKDTNGKITSYDDDGERYEPSENDLHLLYNSKIRDFSNDAQVAPVSQRSSRV